MKILIDARMYGPEHTGNGRYTMNLVEGLARLDTNNKYVILLRKDHYKSLELPNNWQKVLADFRHYSFAEQLRLPSIINKHGPDLVHFPHLNVPILFFGKFIVTIHDMIMHKFKGGSATTRPLIINKIFRMAYHLVFWKAVKFSQKIIVPAKAVKDEVVSYYKVEKDKVNVVYEGFDAKISKKKKSIIGEKYFIYVGNAYPHKNLEMLIKAMVLLNKKNTQRIILLISSARNIFTQRLENLITKYNAAEFVKLLGFVKDKDLGSLYKSSIACVSPSLIEGFGLPGLEGISSGTLFVASDIPVYREVFENHAIYCNPHSAKSIKEALLKAINILPKKRSEMIFEAQKFAKRYSWLKMAKQTLEIYEGNHKE